MSRAVLFNTASLAAIPPTEDVSPEIVRAFWKAMTTHYRTRVVDKDSALEMQAVGALLGVLGIVDREEFLRDYTTTLGRRIYVPFTPGEGADLWGQMVVCVHEHQHVEQLDREGLGFFARYVAYKDRRALYEAEAYRSNLEMHWWRFGDMLPVREIATRLRGYGVSPLDIEVAARVLGVSADAVRRGAIINGATKVAIDWLNVNAPGLRQRG